MKFVLFWFLKLFLMMMTNGVSLQPETRITDHIKITGNNTIMYNQIICGYQLGNYLSAYYTARGYAKLMDLCFEVAQPFCNQGYEWMNYLPTYVCPIPNVKQDFYDVLEQRKANIAEIAKIEKDCPRKALFVYPHECHGFWLHMRKEMQTELQHVIHRWEIEQSMEPLRLDNNTAVIYVRCRPGDSILYHHMYGPVAFSLYNPIKEFNKIIIITAFNTGLCADIQTARVAYLQTLNPKAVITVQSNGTMFDDFRYMARAHTLFIDPSTFALYGGLASNGTVHLSKLSYFVKFTDEKFVWSNATVLLPRVVERELHLKSAALTRENITTITHWLSIH